MDDEGDLSSNAKIVEYGGCMPVLYQDEYLKIEKYDVKHCLEIAYFDMCYDADKLKQLISEIKKQVEKIKATKIIFTVKDIVTLGNDDIIMKELIPCLGKCGIKNFAVVTGYNNQLKTYLHEMAICTAPLKEQYGVTSQHFPTLEQAIDWISKI